MPSTFGTTVGTGLLCQDHIDPAYFWRYLKGFAGEPYQQEGGAYWFKVKGNLWGVEITDVLVSDGGLEQVFLAAQFKVTPAKLAEAILVNTGIGFVKDGVGEGVPLVSALGSKIVYAGSNAKIYCKHYNLDYWRMRSNIK